MSLVRWLVCVVLLVSTISLEGADPRLSYLQPHGAQRGTEVKVTFVGNRLSDAEEIYFYTPGIELVKFEKAPNANQCAAVIKIAPDCRPGEHIMQVRTKSGVSDYRSFHVGLFPELAEKEPNSDFESPQPITLNHTITGVVQREDVDYFVIEAKKGDRISAEVEGMRLGRTMFDPYLAILDSKRFELARSDDLSLLRIDPAVSIIAPADGKYILELRESAYGGSGACRYRMHVGNFPRPTGIYPAGGKVGEQIQAKFLGDAAGSITQTVKLPDVVSTRFGLFAKDSHGMAPSANPFRVSDFGNVLEAEPNNAQAQATPGTLPQAFNGIIQENGDVDYFKFAAKKGVTYDIECYARRLRSPLDPVISIFDSKGKRLSSNDDARGLPDSYVRYRIPADGDYFLMVKDHLDRGGDNYVYRVEINVPQPAITLNIPRTTRYGQERQQITIPRGNRFATLMRVTRKDIGGDVKLESLSLPQGVKISAEPMAANMTTMPVLFEASADAPIGGKLFGADQFRAIMVDPKNPIQAGYSNDAIFVLYRNAPYLTGHVEKLPITVIDESPFSIELVQPKSPLVKNGAMNLKVLVKRKEGFDKPIRVYFPFRPPGVGATSAITIPKGKNEGLYPINANNGARVAKWKVYAIASADHKGNLWVSSQLADLEIAEPFVTVALSRTACEQGEETEILGKLTQNVEFTGDATIKLVGFPSKVTSHDIKFNKEKKEVVFKVKTDKASPAGRHKNIYCQILVPVNGEEVVHRAGVVELRIDKPLPPKKNAPVKPKPKVAAKKPAPKKAPPKKRLTRLEKLRLAAEQRAKEAAGGK